ncbi:MAG: hypothetical protein HY298_02750 [Verrucomicrobia bacterium]|nr:hypothetical protein [Verrucomicrobiota bacterium]
MKKAMVLFIFGLLAARASAVQLYEAFAYPPASSLATSTNGQGGWILTAGTSPTIQAGSLSTPGLAPPSDGNSLVFGGVQMEVRHALTNLLGGEQPGAYMYSLAFKVTNLGTMTTNGDFIAAFSQSTLTSAYGGLLYLRKDISSTPNGYNLGVAKTSGVGGDVEWDTNVYLVGETNFVVCRYATPGQGDVSYLWINPDPSTYGVADANRPAPTLTATAGTDALTGVGQFLLHQVSASEGPGGIVVDQIRVEGIWPSVTPIPLSITNAITDGTNLFLSWGGFQSVYLQQTTSLTPPVTWSNLNGGSFSSGNNNGSIRNYTVTNATGDPVPKFFRLHAWYAE